MPKSDYCTLPSITRTAITGENSSRELTEPRSRSRSRSSTRIRHGKNSMTLDEARVVDEILQKKVAALRVRKADIDQAEELLAKFQRHSKVAIKRIASDIEEANGEMKGRLGLDDSGRSLDLTSEVTSVCSKRSSSYKSRSSTEYEKALKQLDGEDGVAGKKSGSESNVEVQSSVPSKHKVADLSYEKALAQLESATSALAATDANGEATKEIQALIDKLKAKRLGDASGAK